MKIHTVIFFVLLANTTLAQQDPLYSQYMLNPLLINPSYAGLSNNLNGMAGYRTQWTGLAGQPRTMNASVHTSLVNNKIGVGILFSNDKIGNISNRETNASVAYKLKFNNSVFSFGMQAGIQSYRTDLSSLTILDPDDNAFANGERGSRLNIGAGAIFRSERVFIGLSVPRLLPSTFKQGGQKFELYNQHYYLMGGYVYYLSERMLLKPSILLRGVKGAPMSADIAMNFNFNTIHTAGLFTRGFNTYGVLLQTLVDKKYRFGYVFELPTNKSIGSAFTTHEVSLGILLSVFSYHEDALRNF
jgi:type IX secretion system PorP/SprF family membrane protein